MFCDIRLTARCTRACLTILLAGTAAFGLSNNALAAYDFSKLGAAIETLAPETVDGWEKKARAGDAMAQNIMGLAYKCGMGVKQDHAASIQWFRRAAEQGHTQAQVRLAQLFAKGLGEVARDQVQAYKWMSLAAASGEPTAAKVIADYAAQMKPEQVQQAQLLVQEWKRRQSAR